MHLQYAMLHFLSAYQLCMQPLTLALLAPNMTLTAAWEKLGAVQLIYCSNAGLDCSSLPPMAYNLRPVPATMKDSSTAG